MVCPCTVVNQARLTPEGVLTCTDTRYAMVRELEVAVSVCEAGATLLLVVVNTRTGGVITSAGTSATVYVTSTSAKLPSPAVMRIDPVYVPGASPAGFTLTVTWPGVVPLVGDADSHAAEDAALQLTGAPFALVICTVWPGGAG